MICDIVNLNKYLIYKKNAGPFVITFYKEDPAGKNYILYKNLKSLEREFNHVPILRFDYDHFTKYYSSEYVSSPNYLLIIEKSKENMYVEATDLSSIRNVLENVIKMRYVHRRTFNTDFRFLYRFQERTWVVNTGKQKAKDIEEHLQKSVETQYKFPNSTIAFSFSEKSVMAEKKSQLNKKVSSKQKLSKIKLPYIFIQSHSNDKVKDKLNAKSSNSDNIEKLPKLSEKNSYLEPLQNLKTFTRNMPTNQMKYSSLNKKFQNCKEIYKDNSSFPGSIQSKKTETSQTSLETSLMHSHKKSKFLIPASGKTALLNKSQNITMPPSFISVNNVSHLTSIDNQHHVSSNMPYINNNSCYDRNKSKNSLPKNFENYNNKFNIRHLQDGEHNNYNNFSNSLDSMMYYNSITNEFLSQVELDISNGNILKIEKDSTKNEECLSNNKKRKMNE